MSDELATQTIADFVLGAQFEDIPSDVRHEAHRTLLNWMAVAVGGCRHESVDIVLETLPAADQSASVLGRSERTDGLNAALVNGISSHVFDFDDTHLATAIHPAGPVLAAILPIAERQPVTGAEFIHALILGIDVTCRLGQSVSPDHYSVGWHISGTAGIFGAAAAASRLLGNNAEQTRWALGLAATQSSGMREMFGSMCKSFHVGNAAKNGLMSAMLASKGFTSSEQGIEAKRGWAHVTSTKQDFSRITDRLGKNFLIMENSYKPFACGVVVHPGIDGCIQLRNEHDLTPDDIESIELKVHPLVLELTGKTAPRTGLEGKFSIYHSCATAIQHGKGGETEFSDEAVNDPTAVSLREKVNAEIDPSVPADAMGITITTKDGRSLEIYVEKALGSLENPLGDTALDEKTRDLCQPLLGDSGTEKLIETCRGAVELADASAITTAATP
ncbi:MAG: 2-methylcitrate dehydratase [Rhodospirillaceae bacterium]|nr:2-methylcitrate dehydratase [Rhodospirillaceae bacterium]